MGNELVPIINGITKLLLILDTKYEEVNAYWFHNIMQENLSIFYTQILTSSYISSEIVDQKIMCFTCIYSNLLRYSSTLKFRDVLISQVKAGSHLILDRIENCLLLQLANISGGHAGQGYQETSKLTSAFGVLKSYCEYLAITVRVYHIYLSSTEFNGNIHQSDSQVEKIIKLVLSQALQLSSINRDASPIEN